MSGDGGLLSVRSIIAFALVVTVIITTLLGTLDPDKTFTLAVTVVAFYFGTRNGNQPPA